MLDADELERRDRLDKIAAAVAAGLVVLEQPGEFRDLADDAVRIAVCIAARVDDEIEAERE